MITISKEKREWALTASANGQVEKHDLIDMIQTLRIVNQRLTAVLIELDQTNGLHHDGDMYFHELAMYGLGERNDKPRMENF